LTPVITNRQRIEAALRDVNWIAPYVKDQILNVNWEKVGETATANYIERCITGLNSLAMLIAEKSEVFNELLDRFSKPLALEMAVLQNEATSVLDSLCALSLNSLAEGAIDHRSIYFSLNFQVSIQALRLEKPLTETEREEHLNAAFMLASPWTLIGEHTLALDIIATPLTLTRGVSDTPATELLTALRNKIGRFRGLVECEYLKLLAELLAKSGLHRHAVSVGRFRFDSQVGTANIKPFSQAVAYVFDQFAESVPEPFAEQRPVDAETRMTIDHTLSLVRTMVKSSRQLLTSANNEAEPDILTPTEILDGIAGFSEDSGFDFRHFDVLYTLCPVQTLSFTLHDWINTLEERELSLPLLNAISETLPEGETGLHRAVDWWDSPHATGRTLVLSVLLEFLFKQWEFFGVIGYLTHCFRLNGEGAREIGSFLAMAKSLPSRNIAKTLSLAIAIECLRADVENEPLLEVWFGLTAPEDYWSASFHESCQLAFSNMSFKGGVRNVDAIMLVILAQSHTLKLQYSKAEAVLTFSIGCEYFNWALVRNCMRILRDVEPGLFSVLATCVSIFSSTHIEYSSLANRLLEVSHELPDIERCNPDDLASIICQKIDKELCRGNYDCFGIAIDVTRTLAKRGLHDRCLIVGEAVLKMLAKEEAVPQDNFFGRMSGINLQAILAHSLLLLGKHEYFLRLTHSLFSRNGQPDAHSLNITLPAIPAGMPFGDGLVWDLGNAAKALVRSKLQALYAAGRQDESFTCIQSSFSDESWHVREGVGADDVLIAAEVARIVCDRDIEYLRRLYSFSLGVYGDIGQVLSNVARSDISRLLVEVRHSCIQIGTSLSARLPRLEGVVHRISHLVSEARLANQQLQFRCLTAKEDIRLSDRGFAAGFAMEENREQAADLNVESSEVALISFRKSKWKNLSVHPSSIAWEGARHAEIQSRRRLIDESLPCSEENVAAAIGSGTLLRAAFSLDGKLVWTVFRSEGNELRVVAHDSGYGRSEARDTVRRLIEQHQVKLDGIWDAIADRRASRELARMSPQSDMDSVTTFQRHLKHIVSLYSEGKSIDFVAKRILTPLGVLKNLAQHVIEEFGDPLEWPRLPPSIDGWNEWWRGIFRDYFPQINDSASPRKLRDDETWRFLDALDAVIPTDKIAAAVQGAEELIVWPDDELLGVPFAFLQHSSAEGTTRFLFECVESMRTTVSPLCDVMMRQYDSRSRGSTRPMIVSAAYLKVPAEHVVTLSVQRAFATLAAKYPDRFDWKMAHGDACRADIISKGIVECGDRRIAIMVVCGHGAQSPQGVVLNDGTWDGHAIYRNVNGNTLAARTADLSPVDFLIQISCSIGRIKQEGFQDVTGFCANLIQQGIRSVIAGRWTLHAMEGIDLTKAIVDRYLSHYTNAAHAGPLWQSRIRSEAVAHVRKEWAKAYRQGTDDPNLQFGLNTIANMDLYGLG
jgi:hypothetical protein